MSRPNHREDQPASRPADGQRLSDSVPHRTAVVGAEDLVDPQPEHLGDREGQAQRRVVLAVLNGDDRLPRDPQRLAELRLGPAPVPAQAPHAVPHDRPPGFRSSAAEPGTPRAASRP